VRRSGREASQDERPIFVLRLEGKPGRHSIHALRIVLKALLRRNGLRCREVREET
jgi:hypothetical protein